VPRRKQSTGVPAAREGSARAAFNHLGKRSGLIHRMFTAMGARNLFSTDNRLYGEMKVQRGLPCASRLTDNLTDC
jgi:hypothetical protein